jgi:hypothetical protein
MFSIDSTTRGDGQASSSADALRVPGGLYKAATMAHTL